jgi:hypothetical protein
MKHFVDEPSVVREIWGSSDTILFIFAGAAAEFALNKAVDWLYFTGQLPSDPLGRLFSTVSYARKIVFSNKQSAIKAINAITSIHTAVEQKRGTNIPDWAYRDVLFLLIDYSIISFQLLERKLSTSERQEVFDVFYRVGMQMGLKGLPEEYSEYEKMRKQHLQNDLQHSHFTDDLFVQYRKHLGAVRYRLLLESQALVAPEEVRRLLKYRPSLLIPLIKPYKICKKMKMDWLLKAILLPSKYKNEIKALDRIPT